MFKDNKAIYRILISFLSFLLAMVFGFMFFYELGTKPQTTTNTTVEYVFTENMRDCVTKGGEYSLSLESSGLIDYEFCTIEKKIRYDEEIAKEYER